MSASLHSALSHLATLKLTEQAFMDSIFLLGQAHRAAFLQHMTQSFGCSYICLWSNLPLPSNCLLFLDGIYQEESSQQPGPSSGSLVRRLFNAYCESVNYVDDQGRVPGFAFKNNIPYMEVKLHGLERRLSSEMQMQFYQEAGIKTVVFMGCASGEIELGISSEPRVDLEMELKSWFPVDFSRQKAPTELPQPTSQDRPSTSSSLLRSLSVDSSEYSLLFNVQTSSFITKTPQAVPALISTSPHHHSQAENALSQIRNIQFPTIESENAAMTKAILAVLSSPSTSSSSNTNLPPVSPAGDHGPAAFRRYRSGLAPVAATSQKHNMFKRSISFFRNLNMRRRQEFLIQDRPTSTQMHHMISERRRREKLNESFQVLRSLLPPGSKDKASVLSSTTEYISSLKSQVEELSKRNQELQSELSTTARKEGGGEEVGWLSSSSETVSVEIAQVSSASASTLEEARFLDLRVRLRSGECSLLDLVIRVLEFLNQHSNLRLLSVQSNTRLVESVPVHGLVLRLRVKGDEFEERGFQEAVRRVVDHLPHSH
ncbi:putative transcription factor bHLH041 isoform X2 [Sesamum indicum]|uniref:Transcription factor bHLH041 isoform X2 n=1 Tax=Sesamum indicum TaxID=4182 RepID=A0A8M8UQW8_SESIN|nr:putative transcription factor bHLH041 isoform X2 [Sesamum indicum]